MSKQSIEHLWDLSTEAERGYIAGIIDGEGCIYIDKYLSKNRDNFTYALRIRVSMTDVQVPSFLHKKFGGSLTKYEYPTKINNKPTYIWSLVNSASNNFLRLMRPYLLVKAPQVDVGLRFISTLRPVGRHMGRFSPERKEVLDARELLKLEMNRLNQRGKVGV